MRDKDSLHGWFVRQRNFCIVVLQTNDAFSDCIQHLIWTVRREAITAAAPRQVKSDQLRSLDEAGAKLLAPQVAGVRKAMEEYDQCSGIL